MFRSNKKPPRVRYDTKATFEIPSNDMLVAHSAALQAEHPLLARIVQSLKNARFVHPETGEPADVYFDGCVIDVKFVHPETGETIEMSHDGCTVDELSLIGWLAEQCESELSFEVGFGVGTSCAAILAGRSHAKRDFQHIAFEPGVLGGRVVPILELMLDAYEGSFSCLRRDSRIGLGQMIEEHGRGCSEFIFIDGGHSIEHIFPDFVLADMLCGLDGYVVLDDAPFPAIETLISYVRSNRPDYAIRDMATMGITVMKKIGKDERSWDDFKLFQVPQRVDWTRRD